MFIRKNCVLDFIVYNRQLRNYMGYLLPHTVLYLPDNTPAPRLFQSGFHLSGHFGNSQKSFNFLSHPSQIILPIRVTSGMFKLARLLQNENA